MGEKRFTVLNGSILDNVTQKVYYNTGDVVDCLNKQQATISALKEENEQLRQELQKKQEEEKLYANEIVKLNKEVKDNQFLRLGNDY